jgi:hypothetical protein
MRDVRLSAGLGAAGVTMSAHMGLAFGDRNRTDTAAARKLDGRALGRAIRTEDTAVTGLRAEQSTAARAFVEVEAGIRWHDFGRPEAAMRTRENGLESRQRVGHVAPNESS